MRHSDISIASCKRKLISFLVCLSVFLAGCAASTQPAAVDPLEAVRDMGYELGESIPRIHNFHLTSWIYVNRKSVIISTSPRSKFLVVFTQMCRDLSRASTLATRSALGQLSTLDFIYVVDGSMGDAPGDFRHKERCAVSEIYKISVLRE